MNGFTENRAHGSSERPGRDVGPFTWGAGQAMLPLVGRIAADVRRLHERLAQLRPELSRLERARLALAWPQRARRYQLQEEVAAAEAELHSTVAELEQLGAAVLDGAAGLVGFPTVVNDRRAFFSWQPGEEGLRYWNYAGDRLRRPVPAAWTKPPQERAPQRAKGGASRGKSRHEKK
jgi:hypothetical protein